MFCIFSLIFLCSIIHFHILFGPIAPILFLLFYSLLSLNFCEYSFFYIWIFVMFILFFLSFSLVLAPLSRSFVRLLAAAACVCVSSKCMNCFLFGGGGDGGVPQKIFTVALICCCPFEPLLTTISSHFCFPIQLILNIHWMCPSLSLYLSLPSFSLSLSLFLFLCECLCSQGT